MTIAVALAGDSRRCYPALPTARPMHGRSSRRDAGQEIVAMLRRRVRVTGSRDRRVGRDARSRWYYRAKRRAALACRQHRPFAPAE